MQRFLQIYFTTLNPCTAGYCGWEVSGASRVQHGPAPVATECDEVQVPAAVVAGQSLAHGRGELQNPRPVQPKGSSTRNIKTIIHK